MTFLLLAQFQIANLFIFSGLLFVLVGMLVLIMYASGLLSLSSDCPGDNDLSSVEQDDEGAIFLEDSGIILLEDEEDESDLILEDSGILLLDDNPDESDLILEGSLSDSGILLLEGDDLSLELDDEYDLVLEDSEIEFDIE